MEVCPTGATKQRRDGIVHIDYDLCIGCAYCVVACPYQARYKVSEKAQAYKKARMPHEVAHEHSERIDVSQKCTFCSDRIDDGLARGMTPGVDHEATPACVNSCISNALYFGDIEDPDSKISELLRTHKYFRMHEELETEANIYYLWERIE